MNVKGGGAMPSKRDHARWQSVKAAYCGLTVGVGTVLMLLGGVVPVATYAVPLLCGALLVPVTAEFGRGSAWATFFATALTALLLGMDKEAAFFYLFVGYYPILQGKMNLLEGKKKRLLAKAGLFLAALGAMYGALALLFPMGQYLEDFRTMGRR